MAAPRWLQDLPRPTLMAIGDSLLNGMRSYTIDDAKAAASVPTLLGQALRAPPGFAPFVRAKYPASILIDVEGELARHASSTLPLLALLEVLGQLGAIKGGVAANARAWLDRFGAGPGGGPPAFDNLAIAGARITDAFNLTYDQLDTRIGAMAPVVRAGDDPLKWSGPLPASDPDGPGTWGIGDIHISFNARHLRNPANRDGLGPLTVLDVVGARRPKVLLADMGANHGLVDVVMRGQGDRGMDGLRAFAAAWPACARAMARLPGVEVVIVLLLPRPSQTPCLAPPNPFPDHTDLEPAPARPDKYFNSYVSAIDPVSTGLDYDGDTVARFDREMDVVNAEVRAATVQAFAGSGKRLLLPSLADMLGQHDAKHRRGPPLPGRAGRAWTNYPLGRIGQFGTDRLRGGLCGLDQIHPTEIGYRFIAEEVRQALAALPEAPASSPVVVTDEEDGFLLAPHWPTIAALDALYPRAATLQPLGGVAAIADVQKREADRLVFRPGWLR